MKLKLDNIKTYLYSISENILILPMNHIHKLFILFVKNPRLFNNYHLKANTHNWQKYLKSLKESLWLILILIGLNTVMEFATVIKIFFESRRIWHKNITASRKVSSKKNFFYDINYWELLWSKARVGSSIQWST